MIAGTFFRLFGGVAMALVSGLTMVFLLAIAILQWIMDESWLEMAFGPQMSVPIVIFLLAGIACLVGVQLARRGWNED